MTEFITALITQTFTVYIITLVLVKGDVMYRPREIFRGHTPWLIVNGRHFIDCRLCTGFYISMITWLVFGMTINIFLLWGTSYFLVTQERV